MQLRKFLRIFFGFIFLGLGAIGLILPILPTTPFVLLAFWCFSATPRIRKQLMKINFFREHVENYADRKGLSRKTLIISLVWLWAMLLVSIILLMNMLLAFLLVFIGVAVTRHILYMASAKWRKEGEKN